MYFIYVAFKFLARKCYNFFILSDLDLNYFLSQFGIMSEEIDSLAASYGF